MLLYVFIQLNLWTYDPKQFQFEFYPILFLKKKITTTCKKVLESATVYSLRKLAVLNFFASCKFFFQIPYLHVHVCTCYNI